MLQLWNKDIAFSIAAAVAVALVTIVGQIFISPLDVWVLAPAAMTCSIALVLLEVYRRLQIQLKEAVNEQHEFAKATYHQVEALLSILNTIKPTFPLPSTRTWSASPDILNQLCRLVLTRRPELVLELGSGVSTLTMAYCLRRVGTGRIVSLEHDPKFAAVTRQLIADHELRELVTVLDAPLKEIELCGEKWLWYDVGRIPPTPAVDLLFVDGPPGLTQRLARYPAVPVLSPRLAPDCVVVLDDGARPDEKAVAERWASEFGMTSEYLPMEKGAYIMTMACPVASPSELVVR